MTSRNSTCLELNWKREQISLVIDDGNKKIFAACYKFRCLNKSFEWIPELVQLNNESYTTCLKLWRTNFIMERNEMPWREYNRLFGIMAFIISGTHRLRSKNKYSLLNVTSKCFDNAKRKRWDGCESPIVFALLMEPSSWKIISMFFVLI